MFNVVIFMLNVILGIMAILSRTVVLVLHGLCDKQKFEIEAVGRVCRPFPNDIKHEKKILLEIWNDPVVVF